jgi:hypothetical protein
MKALEITLRDGKKILINEDQVSSIFPPDHYPLTEGFTKIKMSNGDEYLITNPPYDQWHNDLFVR